MMNSKHFNFVSIVLTVVILILAALPTVIIDPYFHYHAPLNGYSYPISNERYQNNGIVRNFKYNAVITGTSVTENFKTSELDKLFGTNAIKVTYANGPYAEINDNLIIALEKNPDIKLIVRGLDLNCLIADKDAPFPGIEQGYQYPWYLIDKNPFNDVSYIFNKSVMMNSIDIMKNPLHGEVESFDSAYSWEGELEYGKEIVLSKYERREYTEPIQRELSDEEIKIVLENVRQNIADTVERYPAVEFYFFIPPYNICWWDNVIREGKFNCIMMALQIEIKELVQYENVKLFAFMNNFEMICDLDSYCDDIHYNAEINSQILQWMKEDEKKYLITMDNYREYLEELEQFYLTFDYDDFLVTNNSRR